LFYLEGERNRIYALNNKSKINRFRLNQLEFPIIIINHPTYFLDLHSNSACIKKIYMQKWRQSRGGNGSYFEF